MSDESSMSGAKSTTVGRRGARRERQVSLVRPSGHLKIDVKVVKYMFY